MYTQIARRLDNDEKVPEGFNHSKQDFLNLSIEPLHSLDADSVEHALIVLAKFTTRDSLPDKASILQIMTILKALLRDRPKTDNWMDKQFYAVSTLFSLFESGILPEGESVPEVIDLLKNILEYRREQSSSSLREGLIQCKSALALTSLARRGILPSIASGHQVIDALSALLKSYYIFLRMIMR